ncbi:hyaluronate lyase N-terminal domain-containing protein [Paenibacillus sp. FSL L8-0506]
MENKIQLMRGINAQLTAKGALAVGELGYCADTGELK